MNAYVYSLTEKIFEGALDSVSAPTEGGEITVLKGHQPLITTLKAGHITLRFLKTGVTPQTHNIKGGVLAADQKKVLLLVE